MNTRNRILNEAYTDIQLHGFKGLRTDEITHRLGLTKGAFYHYFSDKLSLGYQVIEEVMAREYTSQLDILLDDSRDPMKRLRKFIKHYTEHSTVEILSRGCPLNNLVQEMGAEDNGFRLRLEDILSRMRSAVEYCLKQAKKTGRLKNGVNIRATAAFVIASLEGAYCIGKAERNPETFKACLSQLISFIHTMENNHE